jgi:hypothetical protein
MASNNALKGGAALLLALLSASCAPEVALLEIGYPSVASARQPTASLKVDASQIRPMYCQIAWNCDPAFASNSDPL